MAVKAVNLNGVDVLLRMFNDWHRTDHHNRHTNIRKAILNSVKALVNTSKASTNVVLSHMKYHSFVRTAAVVYQTPMVGNNSPLQLV